MAAKKAINFKVVFLEDSEGRWERIFELLEDDSEKDEEQYGEEISTDND
jgi:hypothetical protein